MNPSIILAGRQPDILNALMGGTQAAAVETDFRRQQDIQNLYRQQGAGIAAGDPNAINALAGFDPMAALGVQDARLGMDATRLNMDATRQGMAFDAERMEMARKQARQEAQAFAAQMDAAQAAQTAEQLRSTVQGLAMAQTPEQWAGLLAQAGVDPAEAPWEERDIFLAQNLGAAEVLDLRAAQQPATPDLSDRYRVVGDSLVDLGAEGGPSPVFQGAGQQETIYGPDGRPIFTRGSGALPTIPERQSQIQLFGSLMDSAAPVINAFEQQYDPANVGDAIARNTPIVGNFMQSEIGQQYQAAAAAWSEGALRLATGAAATAPEIERVRTTYFAQPGDSPETVTFKRRLREAYQQALVAASAGGFQPGTSQLPPDPLGFADQAETPAQQPAPDATANPFATMEAQELLTQDIGTMNAEQIRAYMARLDELGL